jgi:hypothetical protein
MCKRYKGVRPQSRLKELIAHGGSLAQSMGIVAVKFVVGAE